MFITDKLPNTWYERTLVRRLQVEHDPLWICVQQDHDAHGPSSHVVEGARARLTDQERELAPLLSLSVGFARAFDKKDAVQELEAALSINAGWIDAVDALLKRGQRPDDLSETETRLVEGVAFRRAMSHLPSYFRDRSWDIRLFGR